MNGENGNASIFDELKVQTNRVLDTVADLIAGEANDLRDGSEHHPVELPRDLFAHENAQTEWWYYTGHLTTGSGRKLGFEWVFFKRRTDLDRFAIVPLRLIGNPYYFAHFAITDHETRSFRYAHRKSSNGLLDRPARASRTHYYLSIGDWSARESNGGHHLRAAMDDHTSFDLVLRPSKPVVFNGDNGVSFKDAGEASRYFSFTRMEAEGNVLIDGKVERVTGSAWMDREFGTWAPTKNQKGWDWFSIQFNNGCELMCYQLRDEQGRPSKYSSGTFVAADGTSTRLRSDDFAIEPTSHWKSPRTGAEYPSGWNIRASSVDVNVRIEPVISDQELDTRGTTMIIYWEGACAVTGSANGNEVIGNAYVELVGYDRSHERPNLAYFLIGNPSGVAEKLGFK